jgi:hypothetical protein
VTAVGEPTVTTDIEFVVVNEDGAEVRGAPNERLCRFGRPLPFKMSRKKRNATTTFCQDMLGSYIHTCKSKALAGNKPGRL